MALCYGNTCIALKTKTSKTIHRNNVALESVKQNICSRVKLAGKARRSSASSQGVVTQKSMYD